MWVGERVCCNTLAGGFLNWILLVFYWFLLGHNWSFIGFHRPHKDSDGNPLEYHRCEETSLEEASAVLL